MNEELKTINASALTISIRKRTKTVFGWFFVEIVFALVGAVNPDAASILVRNRRLFPIIHEKVGPYEQLEPPPELRSLIRG